MKEYIDILRKGGIGIIPTDTLYGIVGSAFSKEAVKRIYEVKGRDENKPFIILISSISDLKKFGVEFSLPQKKMLKKLWPNSISVILQSTDKNFQYLHRGTKSLAFRMPKNENLRNFLKKTGPLVAPSANMQGEKPAETIAEAKKYFGDKIDFYISAGRKKGQPSTIITFKENKIVVLREGKTKVLAALRKLPD